MRIDIDDTETDDGLFVLHRGEPFTGEVTESDRDGNLLSLVSYVGGRPDGPEWQWYPNGQPKAQATSVRGLAVGVAKQWHPNGQLAAEKVFTDNGRLVEVREWSEDGAPIERPRRAL